MSVANEAVPEWPGFAGWFGLLLALVWLARPAAFSLPLLAVTLALAGCWLFGLYRHLQHVGWL